MKRILLVIEGFNELAYTETLLKKVGFDCTGTQNELGIAEKILSFRPHVMLATCRGRKVKGETIMERIASKNLHLPSLILLSSPDQKLSDFEISHSRAQQVLISPVSPIQLIEALANATELDAQSLIKKMGRDLEEGVNSKLDFYVQGGAGPLEENAAKEKRESAPEEKKSKRNADEILKKLPETPGGLNRKLVEAQTHEFRKREQDADIKLIDEERQAFVKSMFKVAGKKR